MEREAANEAAKEAANETINAGLPESGFQPMLRQVARPVRQIAAQQTLPTTAVCVAGITPQKHGGRCEQRQHAFPRGAVTSLQ